MPQICSTVPQSTIDAINSQAVKDKRHFSNQVSVILQEWESRNEAKNAKQKVSTKKK